MIGSEIYRYSSYGDWHPLRVPRVSTVLDLSRALGWLPAAQYINSPRAKPAALVGFHTAEYIAALVAAEADGEVTEEVRKRHALGTPSNPVFAEMYRRPATSAGAALLAGELLRGWRCHLCTWMRNPSCASRCSKRVLLSQRSGAGDPVLAPQRGRARGLCRC